MEKLPNAKIINFYISESWGDNKFTLLVDGKQYQIIECVTPGHFAPEGSIYFQISENERKCLWTGVEKIGDTNIRTLICVKLSIGAIALLAKKIEGKEIIPIDKYIHVFINEENEQEAIVYPYFDLDWTTLKDHNEGFREYNLFQKDILPALKKQGFVQVNGRWIR